MLGPLGADLQSMLDHFGPDCGPIRGRYGVALGTGLGYDLGSMLGQFGRPSRLLPLLSSTARSSCSADGSVLGLSDGADRMMVTAITKTIFFKTSL